MKFQYGILLAFVIISCKSYTEKGNYATGSNIVESKDGEEYALVIMDPGFDRWFSMNKRPMNYHTLSYYENENQRYVSAWNDKVTQQAYHGPNYPFETRIDYDPSKNYGLELNYQLYYYFRYIEDVYGDRYDFPI